MRALTKKQKKELTRVYKQYGVTQFENLPSFELDEIEEMNDYETLYQDANRFLRDLWAEETYGDKPRGNI